MSCLLVLHHRLTVKNMLIGKEQTLPEISTRSTNRLLQVEEIESGRLGSGFVRKHRVVVASANASTNPFRRLRGFICAPQKVEPFCLGIV
jgi:hypothetical protein